jgi:hypothetical protein
MGGKNKLVAIAFFFFYWCCCKEGNRNCCHIFQVFCCKESNRLLNLKPFFCFF